MGHSSVQAWRFVFVLFVFCRRFVFAATGIIQSPITSCSKRDLQYARQVQTVFGNSLDAGIVAYQPQRGWCDCTAWAKCDIYDCLVCFCGYFETLRANKYENANT